ncbi:MAG TPA: class I SAM-dependent methyltransferase, partial [Tissierellia bacterium]|nr:class I SAM-dependent methyltransferase [Tissierellia bacterium]
MEHLDIETIFGIKSLSFSNSFKEFIHRFPLNNKYHALDLACGYGQRALYLSNLGFQVTALDHDPKKLKILQEKADEHQLKVISVVGSMNQLPFKDHTFDLVFCFSAIHHQTKEEIQRTISEMHRVLQPEGQVFFDILSEKDSTYMIGEEIGPGTKIGGREGEEGVPHHYTTVEELKHLMTQFEQVHIVEKEYSYIFQEEEYSSSLFEVMAKKGSVS